MFILIWLMLSQPTRAAIGHPEIRSGESQRLADQLDAIRSRVVGLEQFLVDGIHSQKQAKANVRKIQELLKLQKEERELGKKRITELEKTVDELESRRALLHEKVDSQKALVRKLLTFLDRIETASELALPEQEREEAPKRKFLLSLVDRGMKEIEELRVDLSDDETLENQIQEEKQQLAYLFQDLEEQQSVLELNRQLQVEILEKNRDQRLAQLENYRKLKNAEAEVEHLIVDFNARKELEKANEQERLATVNSSSVFMNLRGKLHPPVSGGKVASSFGRSFDSRSQLYVFKKGIDIDAPKKSDVRAISGGKIAFSGELPDYGRVAIIDHGDHFYSLCAHLGNFSRKTGEVVAAGDVIGSTDDQGTPVYFEIRSRNMAVNPLQWISN